MSEPETVPVVVAVSRVMRDVQAVGKGDRNAQQGYNFRGVDAVVNAVGPKLRQHGVVILPYAVETSYRDVTTSTGKPSRECTVTVKYRIYGPAGDYLECETPGESMDFGDKGAPKAMSVAYRIALIQALCLPTHEPDPDAQAYERGGQETRPATSGASNSNGAPATIEAARGLLAASCKQNSWDLVVVGNRYKAANGHALGSATDPALVEAFRKSLFEVSDGELRGEPASANGATR